MIHANLAVTLRLRPIYTPIWPKPKINETTTRAYAPANHPFKGKPETGDVPGYR